jgi:RNA polymerase sigma factor (sigma-70 family)
VIRESLTLLSLWLDSRFPARFADSRLGWRMATSSGGGELVRAAATGDHRAWDELVDRYSGLLWSIAMAYRLDRADAADVVQTVWLRLLENLEKLREPDRVAAWLATTTRRECQRALAQARRVLPTEDHRRLEPRDAAPTPEAVMVASERDRLLWVAFERLPERCRRLLRILMADPPPYEVVAAALGMPVGSIGPTRARCLEQLRRRLSASGISADVGDS